VLLVLNDIYERKSGFYKRHHKATWYRLLGIVVTFHLAMFGFLLFSGHLAR
jgi:MBOAT family protein